jgi:hypothetical protein
LSTWNHRNSTLGAATRKKKNAVAAMLLQSASALPFSRVQPENSRFFQIQLDHCDVCYKVVYVSTGKNVVDTPNLSLDALNRPLNVLIVRASSSTSFLLVGLSHASII